MFKFSFKICLIVIAIMISSCSYKPEAINFGQDDCTFCRMSISDNKFGALIVNTNGRTIKFDALECMAKYIVDKNIEEEKIHSVWTIDYTNPGQMIDARKSVFLRSRTLPSPMAMFLTSFSNHDEMVKISQQHPGEILKWNDVLDIIQKEWN